MRRLSPPRRIARLACLLAAGSTMAMAVGGCLRRPGSPSRRCRRGLDHPWDLAFAGNTMIFTERAGRISSIVNGVRLSWPSRPTCSSPGRPGCWASRWTRCSPATASSTRASRPRSGRTDDVRLVRWTVDPDFTALTNRTDIVTGIPVNTTRELGRHSGCRPRFDPQGRIWVGTGDSATSGTVPRTRARSAARCSGSTATAPAAAGNPGGALDPRIWSYGHRNVQGIAIRPSDGLGVTIEHGHRPRRRAEPARARNFGWNPVTPREHRL